MNVRDQLISKGTSCFDNVKACLKNIHDHNPTLNVFLEIFEDEALSRAKEIDKKIGSGDAGKLAGLVFGIKDVFCYKDHRLSCGSQILEGFESLFSATAVQRLLDEDAIIIGRQNCDEFAMGSSNENSSFGPTLNGLNHERVPGGSSGASAVAVQMDMCHLSIGSDTGGSVRQPGSFCGVIGFKPTYSRISRNGLTAYASSFDCVGILGKEIEEIALSLEVISGQDDYDSTVSFNEVRPYSSFEALGDSPKIGFIKEILNLEGISEEVKENFEESLVFLQEAGFEVVELDFPYLDYLLPTYYILTAAEASSNLSRYDGVRYGHRAKSVKTPEELYKNSRTEGFGDEVIRRIMLGTYVLSADYYDAYFTKAQKVRKLIQDATVGLFDQCDFLVSPTTPTTAFKLGEHTKNPIEMYTSDLLTVQASLAGLPAISIPSGFDKSGMPFGFQIIGDKFNEKELLSFSKQLLELYFADKAKTL